MLRAKGKDIQDVTIEEWYMFLLTFAQPRGRCKYRTGKKGICPKSANTYVYQLKNLLKAEYALPESHFEEWSWEQFRY